MRKLFVPFLFAILVIACEKSPEQKDDGNTSTPAELNHKENPISSDSKQVKQQFSNLNAPMDESTFWGIIDHSISNSEKLDQLETIENELSKLSKLEILSFDVRMHVLLCDSYSSKLMCAGEILHHNCPNFNFEEFRCWIILHGKGTYYNAKSNPNSLIEHFGPEEDCYTNADLHQLATRLLKELHNVQLAAMLDPVKFPYYKSNYPKLAVNWSVDRPQSMRAICPQLFDACWH
jgi:hypothetical protein